MAIKKISHLENVYDTNTVPIENLDPNNLINSGLYSEFGENDKSNMFRSLFEISYNEEPTATGTNTGYQGKFVSKNITYAQLYRDITNNIYYGKSYLSGDKLLTGNFTITGSLYVNDNSTDENENHSIIKDTNITLSSNQKLFLKSDGNQSSSGIELSTNILQETATNNIILSCPTQINIQTKTLNLTEPNNSENTSANITFDTINLNSPNTNIDGENLNIKNDKINLNSTNTDKNYISLQKQTLIESTSLMDVNNPLYSNSISVHVPNKAIIQMNGQNTVDTKDLNNNILLNAHWKVPEDLRSSASLLFGSKWDCDIVAEGIDLFTLAPTIVNDQKGLVHYEFYPLKDEPISSTDWDSRIVFQTIPSASGASHVQFMNDISGIAMRARWADLAECYSADAPYPAGTLVKFGGEEEITIADDEVNAVVSENPAFLMDAENTENVKYKLPIALIGKVKLRILGKVKKFDRIVLSNTPGVGMVKPDKLHLDAIAIALESSEDEKEKMVLCSVKLKF